jgi:hypothetical protein
VCQRRSTGSTRRERQLSGEQVRGEQDVFVVAPGHGVEGVDRFVESRDGYDLVAMEGD